VRVLARGKALVEQISRGLGAVKGAVMGVEQLLRGRGRYQGGWAVDKHGSSRVPEA
jgi:hypothetical protein